LCVLTSDVSGVEVVAGVANGAEAGGIGIDLVFLVVNGGERHEVGAVGHREVTCKSEMSHLY